MTHTLTATEAARSFSELLNRARYQGESFVIVRGREEVARLVPPPMAPAVTTVGQLVTKLRALRNEQLLDDDFARDLERAREAQSALPGDPWES